MRSQQVEAGVKFLRVILTALFLYPALALAQEAAKREIFDWVWAKDVDPITDEITHYLIAPKEYFGAPAAESAFFVCLNREWRGLYTFLPPDFRDDDGIGVDAGQYRLDNGRVHTFSWERTGPTVFKILTYKNIVAELNGAKKLALRFRSDDGRTLTYGFHITGFEEARKHVPCE